jgi:NAD(P)H dehydrogenase (quinone)
MTSSRDTTFDLSTYKLTILTNLVKFKAMKIVEILCHPRPGSFNLALAATARQTLQSLGHEVFLHDLYREGFDPVLGAPELARSISLDGLVQVHCTELSSSDGLLVFHPDWWGQPPAMLKGWIDRVFRQGVAYDSDGEDFGERKWTPLLSGKKGLVFCTSDARENDTPDTLDTLWTKAVLGRCGMESACFVIKDLTRTDTASRRQWLEFMVGTITEWFPRCN